jgi:NAD(P)-dependent dehydrogenase (short-subunit alcohol dehydrogenase family)/ferredoxin
LASYDPVALDTIAVDIVGLGATLTTSTHGDRLGVGIARRERITIRPRLDQVHASGRQIGFPAATPTTTGRVEQLIRLASHSLMAGRPWIDPVACTGCGVCTSACTPHAINRAGNGFVIDLERCTDCGYCQRVCDQNAISLRPRHPAIRLLTRTWKRAKCGARVPLGPVALSVRLERTPRKSQPHRLRRHLSQAEDGAPTAGRAVSTNRKVAVVVGVGAKLGSALVRRFANDDFDVIAVARGSNLIDRLADELHDRGQTCLPVTCDATYWRDVDTLFEIVERFGGAPDIVVYNIEEFSPGRITSIEPAAFENCWRFNCLGGFLVGRKAARSMLAARHGTILFSGATGAWRGRAGYINLAVGKFGLRALSQSMARELGPKGIHVAHIVLDSGMLRLDPTAVADAYLNLHRQPPTAWTQEIDLRPFNERW